jgi:hypothetical protein
MLEPKEEMPLALPLNNDPIPVTNLPPSESRQSLDYSIKSKYILSKLSCLFI